MTDAEFSELKAREEAKREHVYDPALRWKHLQDMITWAEENMPPHLRRNRPRLHSGSRPTS
jgi:hypothetical protein